MYKNKSKFFFIFMYSYALFFTNELPSVMRDNSFDKAQPYTEQEKCLVYLWQALPHGNCAKDQLPPLIRIVLDYADDPAFGQYKKEAWHTIRSTQGLLRDVSWPYVSDAVMINNGQGSYDWIYSKKQSVDDSLHFRNENIENLKKFVQKRNKENIHTMTSICSKYRIKASVVNGSDILIQCQTHIQHEQRINMLIKMLAEQAKAQDAKVVIKQEKTTQENEQCPCEECETKYFRYLRSDQQHPYTEKERTLASALMLTPLVHTSLEQDDSRPLSRVLQLILDYYDADQWLDMHSINGQI